MCATTEHTQSSSTLRCVSLREPLANIHLLHDAIRRTVASIEADVSSLDVLSPDATFVDIYQRTNIVERIVLSHCRAEDATLIPALSEKVAQVARNHSLSASPSTSNGPPAKRPRNSPVSVNIAMCSEDHDALAEGFVSLRNVLSQASSERRTPADTSRTERRGSGETKSSSAGQSWSGVQKAVLMRLKEEAKRLVHSICKHLDNEERDLLPMSQIYHTPKEQGLLLVKTLLVPECPYWPRSFEYMKPKELQTLLSDVSVYATDKQLERISIMVAPFVSKYAWAQVCRSVPALSKFSHHTNNPLKEIALIRQAIRNELYDLIPFSRKVNISCKSQLHSLASRFDFVQRLISAMASAEHQVLGDSLQSMLSSTPNNQAEFSVMQYHVRSKEIAVEARELKHRICSLAANNASPKVPDVELNVLVQNLRAVAQHFIEQLDFVDKQLYPLIVKSMDLKEQELIVSDIVKLIPESIKRDLLTWMFNLLTITELESMMRKLTGRVSKDEFRIIVESIVESVRKGTTDACEWAKLCSRVPEVRNLAKLIDSTTKEKKHGHVSEILRVHKAIRADINALLRRIRALPVDGTIPNPRTLSSIAMSVAFLRRMVDDHSRAEDDILLPKLEDRKPGSTGMYASEHCNERILFEVLARCIQDLQCVAEEQEAAELVWRLRIAARTLRDDMAVHLSKEEEHLWPLVTTLFSREEQSQIVALIFGNLSEDRLRELLPWMMRVLSVGERNEMMEHILEVTSSTMFDKWLRTWLPFDFEASEVGQPSSSAPGPSGSKTPDKCITSKSLDLNSVRELVLKRHENGREGIQKMVRAIAQMKHLDRETRTRLMQEVMLAPYTERQGKHAVSANCARKENNNIEPSFTISSTGDKVLGCEHYQRAVKLRAACCGRLYTCRLCHDKIEETHVLDRYSTSEILCMYCSKLQPVSNQCNNLDCKHEFAKYFCSVCKIYEDNPSRKLYHCHSCNVCRVGKGLGIDFFHCMKCNQCMSIKYKTTGHKCVENSAESDCPVCYEYLFTSTAPIKHLKCGHLMHTSCYSEYMQKCISCPVCAKSLEEIAPLYKRLDAMLPQQNIPGAHQFVVFCNDCNQRNKTPFGLYLRCPNCHSYNIRKEGIHRPSDS